MYNYFSSFSDDVVIPMDLSKDIDDIYFDINLISTLFDVVEGIINATLEDPNAKIENETLRMRRRRLSGVKGLDLPEDQKEFLRKSPFIDPRGSFYLPIRSRENIEYVYAHAVTQSVIYSAKDTNDYLVNTVHDFANLRISASSSGGMKNTIYKFITDWMDKFNIGKSYRITSTGGEAHVVKIINKNDNIVNMADLGMGSIQLMILLFRIATTMYSARRWTRTIILEEPEQNLHPMLQSKLAEFLLEIYEKYGFNFIVETHSEYLVRSTQVIVGDKYNTPEKLKENPFRVIYFPNEGVPYDMKYTKSGRFEEKFGEGFFDEAAKLHMQVLENSR